MRIDYSEPKKSYTSPQAGLNRPRNESSGSLAPVVIIASLISLVFGFGSGWTLSQRSAKKGFKAAMEQQSLENSSRPSPPTPQSIPTQSQDAIPGGSQNRPGTTGTQATPDPQLSFYKNLPSGQKNNALGSGINVKDDKPAKQPLQAAIPTNFTKQPQEQNTIENIRPPTPAAVDKTASHRNANVFTVQVSSHSLKSEAETLKNKLAGKGYSVYIAESNQGNKGIWYRVRVGRGLEQDAAKELAAKLGKGAMAIPDKE
ncbi:MAG: SPOR domain-containing protein [Desulfuromonadaceae bacterium]|nr:SPOR domain-containing protein [Desulfuromonadaceae bacterium]